MPLTSTPLSRRTFLQGITVALSASAFGFDQFLGDTSRAVAAVGPTLPVGAPVVVVIDLGGGDDILNVHVPIAVPNVTSYYRSARPAIGITRVATARPYGPPPNGDYLPPALDLEGGWAFHGALPWLANRWHDRGDVAVVQGTGENVVREMSHFAAFAYRWAGAFSGNLMNTGWLGRYNDAMGNAQPLGSISLGGLNQALTGAISPAVSINDLASFNFNVSNVPDRTLWLNDLGAMGDQASPGAKKVAVAARALDNARQACATAASVPVLSSPGGGGQLGSQLVTAASLIAAGVPCQTYVAALGAWDHHSSEPYNQWERLTALNAALAEFFAVIEGTSRANDVFVMIHSEFGRQVTQNAGQGTDHGLASSTLLIGGGVRGGRYGQMPDLAPAARYYDAMVATVDFRSVYATVLNRLGGDPNLTDAALGRDESGNVFADLGVFTGSTPPPGSTTTAAPTTTPTEPSTTIPSMTTMPATTLPATTTTMPATTTTMPATTTTMPATTTTVPATLAAPTGVTATSPRRGRLAVNWKAVAGASTYSVWINGSRVRSGITATSVTITGLASGLKATVTVRAHRGTTTSPPSTPVTVTIR